MTNPFESLENKLANIENMLLDLKHGDIKNSSPIHNTDETQALQAKDVEKLFNISSTTRWRWTKIGILDGKKVGNRIYYLKEQVESILKEKGGEK